MNYKFLSTITRIGSNHKLKRPKSLPSVLPPYFFFTDRAKFNDIFSIIKNLPKNTAIIIREYDLDDQKRLEFALKVIEVARQEYKKSLKVLVGKNLKMAVAIKADGVHFSDQDHHYPHKNINIKNIKNFLFTYACHRPQSINCATRHNYDLVFYSPIFNTKSHPHAKPLGTLQLRKITLKSKVPVYALGGIDENNIKQLIGCNIAGIGAISLFK